MKSPIITRRRALWLVGGLAGGVTLHGCTQSAPPASTASPEASPAAASGSAGSAPASPTSTVKGSNGSTLWIGYSPLYIAVEKGFFKENGLELDHRVFGASTEASVAFVAKQLNSTNYVTSEAMAALGRGHNFKIIQVADTSLGGDGILARNSISDLAGFKGKEIAVDVGGVSHFFLLQVLQTVGLTSNDVKIRNLTPDAAAAAYSSGNVDIAVTYSPFLKQANDAQKDGRVIFDTSKMPTAIVDVYCFNTDYLDANPPAGEAFVRGIFKAKEFMQTNKEEAFTIAGKQLGLKPEEVETELSGVDLTSLENNVKMIGDSASDIYLLKHLEALGQFLKDQGQIPNAPTAEQTQALLEPKFIKAIAG